VDDTGSLKATISKRSLAGTNCSPRKGSAHHIDRVVGQTREVSTGRLTSRMPQLHGCLQRTPRVFSSLPGRTGGRRDR
jgi:hypothetical protein